VKPPRQEVIGVAAPNWDDDEELMQALREALRVPAADPKVVEAAKGAFAWLTIDQDLQLVPLLYDSEFDQTAAVRDRGPGRPRLLEFGSGALSVELEVGPGGIEGQLIPPQTGEITLVTADGGRFATATADDVGCFALPSPSHGPVRLQCATEQARLTTEWLTI
jgi:hypothetical protein